MLTRIQCTLGAAPIAASQMAAADAAAVNVSNLTTNWTHPGSDNAWRRLSIGLAACAHSVARSVPESAACTLVLAGFAGMDFIGRHRRA